MRNLAECILRMAAASGLAPGDEQLAIVERPDEVVLQAGGRVLRLAPAGPYFQLEIEASAKHLVAMGRKRRVAAMLAAMGHLGGTPPLWMVCASTVLAEWIGWAGVADGHERGLRPDALQTPSHEVTGTLDISSSNGATRMRGRVYIGFLTGSLILRSSGPRCTYQDRPTPRLIVEGPVPETMVTAINGAARQEQGALVRDIVRHAFLQTLDLRVTEALNVGGDFVLEVESGRRPLLPVPQPALLAVGRSDSACPWDPTAEEVEEIRALVSAARLLGRG